MFSLVSVGGDSVHRLEAEFSLIELDERALALESLPIDIEEENDSAVEQDDPFVEEECL